MELDYLMSLIYITEVWMCMRISVKISTLFGFWEKNYTTFQQYWTGLSNLADVNVRMY